MDNQHIRESKQSSNRKLIASICMLLVASIMVITSTYAWVVLSTAPEVTEITTTVGANGALEIRLNIEEDPDDKNSQFRNIVDFTNSKYGLDQIVLLPSILSPTANLKEEVLQVPEYGDDGLATGQGMPNKTVIGSWETDGYFYKSDVTGVRAVGSVSNMTERMVRFDNAIAAARSALSAAKSNATTSLKNDAFVGIVIKMMTNGDGGYEAEDVEKLGTIITKLEASVNNMKEAYKQMIIAAAASDNGQDDIMSDLVVKSWGSENLTLEAIASTGVIAIGEHSYNAPDEILAGIRSVLATSQTVAAAKTSYDNLNGDYSRERVNPIITTLVNKDNVLVNGVEPSQVNYTDIMLNGATITMLPGAGVYVEIADQVGDFSAQITKTISMKTQSDVAEKYIPTAIAALQTKGAPGGEIEDLPMTALYGYIIDLGFKTNAQNSNLLLQTEAIDRIDNNNPTDATMGGGSYMEFSVADGAEIGTAQVVKIMSCFRIVFFDTVSGDALGYASLGAAVVGQDDSVTAKIEMDNADQIITSLDQNKECKVSVLVYLDAKTLENKDVAATVAQSITGVMNLQFASDAELIPAYSNQNTNSNYPYEPEFPKEPSEGLEFTLNSTGTSYSVTGIGTCTDTDIVIPVTYNDLPVTRIGEYAFEDDSITSIKIPDSVITIGDDAFLNCLSLTTIELPDSLKSIGEGAFFNCGRLKDVYYTGDIEGWLGINFNGISIHSSPTSHGLNLYFKNELVTEVIIPESVTRIGRLAFYNYSLLTKIVIPDSVTSIGERAFAQCSSLTNIEIPDSVRSIGANAFASCDLLTSIEIPDSVTSIGDYAFGWCTSLTNIEVDVNNQYYKSIDGNLYNKDGTKLIQYAIGKEANSFTIPDSVTSIGERAFNTCYSLTSINFNGTVEQWNAISKGSYWDNNTSSYTIYCTDGQIAKNGTVTYY